MIVLDRVALVLYHVAIAALIVERLLLIWHRVRRER